MRQRSVVIGAIGASLCLTILVIACGGTSGPNPPPPPPPSPANLVKQAGDNQNAEPGQAVAVPPSVKVTTGSGAAVSGVTVTFAVASGGGSITGATPVTGSDGVATVGSWTLGPGAGPNTVTASIAGTGVSGNPATFSANAQFASFNPTANTTLSGTRDFSSLNIPAGVAVTVTGPLVIRVTGNASIAGTLTGDCMSIELRVTGNLTVDGLVRNTCTVPAADPAGIKLLADGDLIIGTTVSNQDAIVSDGSIRLTDTATENLTINPLVMFPSFSDLPVSGTSLRLPWAPASAARAGRPIRAGRGKDVTETRDGPIEVAGLMEAGHGADLPEKTQAGTCDNSTTADGNPLVGGTGGRIQLIALNSTLTFKAGAIVKSGNGGKGGTCTAPSGCPATAVAGRGGTGGSILLGGSNIVFEANVKLTRGNGGIGGDAVANADHGPAACANGCHATATGGQGGNAGGIGFAVLEPGTITGAPIEEGADGGTGGLANAVGGAGKDCNVCPAGKGGNGGNATATGGQGGNGATGNMWPMAPNSHLKGNGGGALAVAGNAGKGASCCEPQPQEGGMGGNGGTATATGGQIGAAGVGGNGNRGVDAGFGGDGGHGGDGTPHGAGGTKGQGIGDPENILDGEPGGPGLPCIPQTPVAAVEVTPQQYGAFEGLGGSVEFTVVAKDAQGQPLDREIDCWVVESVSQTREHAILVQTDKAMIGNTFAARCVADLPILLKRGSYELQVGLPQNPGAVTGRARIDVAPRPTGSALLVVREGNNDQIKFWNFADNTVTPITNHVGFVLGFDFDDIAGNLYYGLGPGPQGDIWKLNIAGGPPINLTNNALALNRFPFWDSNSQLIWFNRGANLWRMDGQGDNVTQLTFTNQFDTRPTVSPNGNHVAFVRVIAGNSEIFTGPSSGLIPMRFTDFGGFDGEPFLLNDRIVWTRNDGDLNLYTADFPGGANLRRLTEFASSESGAQQGCGDGITFISNRSGAVRPWEGPWPEVTEWSKQVYEYRPPPVSALELEGVLQAFKRLCPAPGISRRP